MTKFEIEVGSKPFLFNVGILFLGQYISKKKTDIETLFKDIQESTLVIVPDLRYESAKYANPKIKESKSDFYDLIDSDGLELTSLNAFIEKLTKSLTKDVPKEEDTKEESKKK